MPASSQGGRSAAGRGGNFIVSPLSCPSTWRSRWWTPAHARGETCEGLLEFLGSASLDELVHGTPAMELVGKLNDLTQTSFACGLWVDRGWTLAPEFMVTAASRYAATADSVDFVQDAEQARRRVNAFVADATNKLIPARSTRPRSWS